MRYLLPAILLLGTQIARAQDQAYLQRRTPSQR